MFLHIGLFGAIAGLTGEDDELADHIGAAEVDAWVGFREAVLLGQTDSLG